MHRVLRRRYYQGIGTIRVEEVPKPVVMGPEDAIIRVTTTCICGSDLHILHGELPVEPGTVIGHEFVTPLITHRLPLTEALKAYEIFEKKLDGAIKVILKP